MKIVKPGKKNHIEKEKNEKEQEKRENRKQKHRKKKKEKKHRMEGSKNGLDRSIEPSQNCLGGLTN